MYKLITSSDLKEKINLLAITRGPLSSTFLSLKIVVWWEKSLMESKKHEHKGQGKRKTSVCKLLSHTIHHLSSNEWLLNEYWTWTNHHISVQSKKWPIEVHRQYFLLISLSLPTTEALERLVTLCFIQQ